MQGMALAHKLAVVSQDPLVPEPVACEALGLLSAHLFARLIISRADAAAKLAEVAA